MSSEASVQGTVRVRDVVRDVVAEVAPEESSVIAGLAQFDDAAVVRLLKQKGNGRREPLGFGLGEIAVMATPVVWLVVDQAARQIGSVAADGATVGARSLVRRILRRRSAEVTVPSLAPEQLAEVHRQVLEAATRRGLERERAEVLADAVVARLTLSAMQAQTGESADGHRNGDASSGAGGPAAE
ncbi:hypothetical protein [Streptomyces scopuliridis]|uniref:hypothetical protein n=1 Tax=Streptomyces scopuliridis TaxID=452529 RepID=UPI0007C48C4D|nr:hypothetical protein [Streptomyces scopuliridis]